MRQRQVGWVLWVSLAVPAVGWNDDSVPAGYQAVAAERGTPASLLYAVALTESGKEVDQSSGYKPWPWTLNVAGNGYFYATRLEAWQALRDWLDEGQRSIDIGLMQVNWRYHGDRLGTPWQALAPYHNLRVGADILKACYAQSHDWWASVGCYHAPGNRERAARYRARVVSQWRRLMRRG